MSRHILKTILVFLAGFLCVGATLAGSASGGVGFLKGNQLFKDPQQFKVKAGGQLDPSASSISFAGHAMHLGQFTAAGQFDPATLTMSGIMDLGQGDSILWFGGFVYGAAGELTATLRVGDGTGRFANIDGTATGPVALDSDSMFTMDLEGLISLHSPSIRSCPNRQSDCNISCEESEYTHGVCVDYATGEGAGISVQCCCCTDGWENRTFIGE
jgi:hypothetical protein